MAEEPVLITYRDRHGEVTRRRVVPRRLEDGGTRLVAWCLERRAARTFRVERIVEIIDLVTGEIAGEPLAALTARLAERPAPAKRRRITTIDVAFVAGLAVGWHFAVTPAFRAALDIVLTPRVDRRTGNTRLVWTRGLPPAYAFGEGDLFIAPAMAAGRPWAETLGMASRIVKVSAAEPDSLDRAAPGGIREGWVSILEWRPAAGRLEARRERRLSQRAFAEFLRIGEPADGL